MSAEVLHLPAASQKPSEFEARIIGAALGLGLTDTQAAATGLSPDDMGEGRHREAWRIVRRLAEGRRPVNAMTVYAYGANAKVFTDSDLAWLESLQQSNLLDGSGFSAAVSAYRNLVRGRNLAMALEEQVRHLRTGMFNAAMTASTLLGLANGLARDSAPDEDASGDVMELLNERDEAQRQGEKPTYLPTCIQALDAEVGGFGQYLTIIAADPGVGKSAVIGSIIRAQLERFPELHLGIFGLEDGTAWITRRWMAHASGLLLREVAWKRGTVEQEERLAEAAAKYHALLQRTVRYRHDTITTQAMVHRAYAWKAQRNIGGLYIDNLSEVESQGKGRFDAYWERTAETVREMRNFAIRTKTPTIMLVHTTDEGQRKPGPPRPSAMAGGQAIFRKARLQLLLWRKGTSLRCTFGKATEAGEAGTTVELERIATAGLISTEGGEKVDLAAEAAIARRKTEEEKEAKAKKKREQLREERAQAAAAKSAAKTPPPEAQAALPLAPPKEPPRG